MNYPVILRVQAFSLSAKVEAVDALHQPVCFVRKQRLKFREHVIVYASRSSRLPLCEIRAEPAGEYAARYSFTDPQGQTLGAIAREHSAQTARYLVEDQTGQPVLEILPKNPRTRTVDRFLSGVPVVRLFSACLLRPAYSIRNVKQEELFRLQKRAAPMESRYLLRPSGSAGPLAAAAETRMLMAVLMIVFLEG